MKVSKKNQDPNQVKHDAVALEELAKKKCQHYAMGTGVVKAPNIRGKITGMSKDGGKSLLISWEDDTTSVIPNPNVKSNWGKPVREIP